ncbi:MAG: hypothetical protein ACJ76V_12960 [Thermoleophilaceae bacterium]
MEGGATAAMALAAARALYRRAAAARAGTPAPQDPPPPGVVSALERAVMAAQRAANEVTGGPRPASSANGDTVSERDIELARQELAAALQQRADSAAA